MNIYELKRYDLYPYLIKEYHLYLGVEVGVREGYHAKNLLEKTDMFLYGIDIKEDERAIKTFDEYKHKSIYIIEDSNIAVSGIFSGDDYQSLWSIAEGTFGIVDAVEEFILDKNIELNISGLGIVSKSERLKYAREIGYKTECNLMIGMSKYYYVEPRLLEGRKEYNNVDIPQWWFIKKE